MLPDVISAPYRKATQADIERVMTAVERAIRECAKQAGCSHAIICLDAPGPSYRKEILPEYKANRNTVTGTWVEMLHNWFWKREWRVIQSPGAEADDVIFTVSRRLTVACHEHAVLSGDSDLLCLAAKSGCEVWQFGRKPEPKFVRRTADWVHEKYGVPAFRLPFYKAMVGEPGDNIPGVRGVGPKKAVKFLDQQRDLYEYLADHSSEAVAQFDQCIAVVALNLQVPLDPIAPSSCVIP